MKIEISRLVLDYNIYPRNHVNEPTVTDYANAMARGDQFPPVIADEKSLRVVDGWTRINAVERHLGANASIDVELRNYKSDAEMVEDAARLNTDHGQRLSHHDVRRAILLCQDHGLSADRIAAAMHMTIERMEKFADLFHIAPDGRRVPGKQSTEHLAGRKLTKKQHAGLSKSTGGQHLFFINQVINLIENDLLLADNENILNGLARLAELLEPFKREAAA